MRQRGGAVVYVIVSALASGGTLAAQSAVSGEPAVGVRVELPPDAVEFGREFELAIERSWPVGHAALPFDPLALLPLAAVELGADARQVGERLIETRRFRATAWQVGELALGPFVLKTRDPDGGEHAADSGELQLRVRSALPEPPGELEWPGDVRDRPRPTSWLLPVAVALAALLLGGGVWRWRVRRALPAAEAPGPTPAELARTELAALALPDQAAAIEGYYVALAEIVRRFAERRYALRAFVHTSEELVAVVPIGGDPLADCLFACDLVKFAVVRPASAAHTAAKTEALAFVDAADDARGAS
ncbi:MAG: hypothetical protein KDE27_27945 [Planctomycetes bacterium]|nr:hypothetical protein [Planctomycetota bacterium]